MSQTTQSVEQVCQEIAHHTTEIERLKKVLTSMLISTFVVAESLPPPKYPNGSDLATSKSIKAVRFDPNPNHTNAVLRLDYTVVKANLKTWTSAAVDYPAMTTGKHFVEFAFDDLTGKQLILSLNEFIPPKIHEVGGYEFWVHHDEVYRHDATLRREIPTEMPWRRVDNRVRIEVDCDAGKVQFIIKRSIVNKVNLWPRDRLWKFVVNVMDADVRLIDVGKID